MTLHNIIYRNKVSKETFWATVSKAISALSNLFILIFVPRVASVEIYGGFSLILAYIAILGIFFGSPIQIGVKKEITENKFGDISKRYFFEGLKLNAIFSLFFIVLLFFSLEIVEIPILDQNFSLFVILCMIMNLWGLVVNSFEAVHRLFYETLIYFIEYATKIILILYFYFFSTLTLHNLLYSFIFGYSFAFLVGFFIFIMKFKNIEFHNLFKIDKELSSQILYRSFFLALTSISFIILTRVDSIMISFFLSVEDVGYYNIPSDLAKNFTIVSMPLIIGVLPLFAKTIDSTRFYKIMKKLIIVNICIFGTLVLLADYIITFLYGQGFGSSIPVLRILAIYPLFAVIQQLIQGILILMDSIKQIFIFGIIAVISNIVLNISLIPIMGINGAAFATILSYTIWTFMCFIHLKSKFD